MMNCTHIKKILITSIFFYTFSQCGIDPVVWLYKLLHTPLSRPGVSQQCGTFANSKISKATIGWFTKYYKINTAEAEDREYKTLNDFFTRKLKPGMRPIQDGIVSPADGMISVFRNVQKETSVMVKGIPFNLGRLIGSQRIADQFYGGTITVIYLAPHNYHRYHAPITCTPSLARRIKGRYESVSHFAYNNKIQPLTENERQLIKLNNNFLYIPVGAMCVGRIVNTYKPSTRINKGAEMGFFEFGGSTIVMVTKKNYIEFNSNLTHKPTPIRMGQQIGSINPSYSAAPKTE